LKSPQSKGRNSFNGEYSFNEIPNDLTLFFYFSVGRPIHQKVMITQNEQDTFIGDAADKYKGILKFNYPIEHGII